MLPGFARVHLVNKLLSKKNNIYIDRFDLENNLALYFVNNAGKLS